VRRILSLSLVAVGVLLAVHILVILYTGGYATGLGLGGIRLEGHNITAPMIMLLGVGIVSLVLTRDTNRKLACSHQALFLFAVILTVYLANGRTIGAGDTLGARFLPLSILQRGSFTLDEFTFLHDSPFVVHVRGHYLSPYPIGAALLAVPLYVPAALGHVNPEHAMFDDLEKLSGAVFVSLSALVLFVTLLRVVDRKAAVLITLVYAFGTSSLSVSSQALWQHSASQLALCAALYCMVRGEREDRWMMFAGFPLAFAVVSRPTDAFLALPLAIYVICHRRRSVGGFVLSSLPPIAFHVLYNATYFGSAYRIQFFRSPERAVVRFFDGVGQWRTPFWEGLSGILFSPGRGLFVYTPIFLLSIVGLGLSWRKGGSVLLRYLGGGVVLTIFVYSKWFSWWGGYTYGPRLLADLTPVLSLGLYPLMTQMPMTRTLRIAFVVLGILSVGAHSIGAFVDDGSWNRDVDVDQSPGRLWDWKNNQLVNPMKSGWGVLANVRAGR